MNFSKIPERVLGSGTPARAKPMTAERKSGVSVTSASATLVSSSRINSDGLSDSDLLIISSFCSDDSGLTRITIAEDNGLATRP